MMAMPREQTEGVYGVGAEDQQKCYREFIHRCFSLSFWYFYGVTLYSDILVACQPFARERFPRTPNGEAGSNLFDLAIQVIAGAPLGPNQAGLGGIGFDFPAQAQDLDIDGSIVDVIV